MSVSVNHRSSGRSVHYERNVSDEEVVRGPMDQHWPHYSVRQCATARRDGGHPSGKSHQF